MPGTRQPGNRQPEIGVRHRTALARCACTLRALRCAAELSRSQIKAPPCGAADPASAAGSALAPHLPHAGPCLRGASNRGLMRYRRLGTAHCCLPRSRWPARDPPGPWHAIGYSGPLTQRSLKEEGGGDNSRRSVPSVMRLSGGRDRTDELQLHLDDKAFACLGRHIGIAVIADQVMTMPTP